MAAAMNVFGTTPAAARLVPVLAALGLVVVTAWLGTLLFDRRSALAGALVLATTLAFLSFARVAMSDMLLALLSTLAVSLAVLRLPAGRAPRRGPAARGGGGARLRDEGTDRGADPRDRGPAAAVGEPPPTGSRGPPRERDRGRLARLRRDRLRLVRAGPPAARRGAARLLLRSREPAALRGETYDIGRPVWFYLPAYLAEGLPWSAFLPIAVARLLRSRRSGDEPRGSLPRALGALGARPPEPLAGQDRLLPAAALPGGLAARAAATWPRRRGAVSTGPGRASSCSRRRRRSRSSSRGPPQVPPEWLPGGSGRGVLVAVLVAGAIALRRRGLAAVARRACWRLRRRSSPRPGSASSCCSCRRSRRASRTARS